MKTFGALNKTYLHFAILFSAMIVFAFSQAQSQNENHLPQVVSTLRSIDTLRTDTSEIITRTYSDSITKIDSSYAKPLSLDVKKEMESGMAQFKESMEGSTEFLNNMTLSMDSIRMKTFLDSLITVSYTDMEVSIAKLDKCTTSTDTTSIRKGLDVLIKMINMQANGRKVDATYLSPDFLSTVTISEIKETTANLRTIDDQLRKLKAEKSGALKISEFSHLSIAWFHDRLINRTLENIMHQAILEYSQSGLKTETTTVVQTRTERSETLINTPITQP